MILESSERHKIKNIMVMPERFLSLQMHHHRSEHWVVVKGMACVQVNGKQQFLRQGESTFIRSGEKHRLSNPGNIPLEIIEVQLVSALMRMISFGSMMSMGERDRT